MSEPIKCFMVEPVYGEEMPDDGHRDKEWPEHRYILRWRNPATGEEKEWPYSFGPGAMWWATWIPKNWAWDDEIEPHLHVALPGGAHWDIDSRASNCPRPQDRNHRCWHREGVAPNITVTKGPDWENGAGSVLTSNWHGYLRNGELVV